MGKNLNESHFFIRNITCFVIIWIQTWWLLPHYLHFTYFIRQIMSIIRCNNFQQNMRLACCSNNALHCPNDHNFLGCKNILTRVIVESLAGTGRFRVVGRTDRQILHNCCLQHCYNATTWFNILKLSCFIITFIILENFIRETLILNISNIHTYI